MTPLETSPKIEILAQTAPVVNYLSQDKGILEPLKNADDISEHDIEHIVSICGSPKVFDLVFADLDAFKGRGFQKGDAQYLVNEKGCKGWKNMTNFVYIVRNSGGNIVCAINIKSADINGAEIGYWADENEPGWMTNTTIALVNIAKEAGFKKLFGLTRHSNEASMNVLLRADFVEVDASEDQKEKYRKFELDLA